jgi:hypothetical protein
METKEIKFPAHISGFRIKHFHSLIKLDSIQDPDNPTIADKILLCSEFTEFSYDQMKMVHVKSINKIFRKLLRVLDTFHPMPLPPAKLQYDGQVYVLCKDFTKLKSGWFVDISSADLKKDPALMAAFCYIEEGIEYAQTDKHENIINPLKNRKQIFEKHMPLNHYIDLSTFFLRIWIEWKGSSIQTETRKKEIQKMREKLQSLNGNLQSMKLQKNSEQIGIQS